MISQAQAQTAGGGAGVFELFFPLILVFLIIYFLIIRPQQKRQRTHAAMLAALKPKDKVVTQGGLIGEVVHVGDAVVKLKLAEGMVVETVKTMIISKQEN